MPESRPGIRERFADIEPLRGAELVRKLPGGPASDSWLLKLAGRQLVARIDKPAARALKLDRQAEVEVLKSVSAAGIGPELVWADPQQGVLVCSYIEGDAWRREDTRNPALLRELASTLKRLHGLAVTGPEFEPEAAAQNYAEALGTVRAKHMAEQAGHLAIDLRGESGRSALCHNDLVHSNIIHHGPVRLIDWEYAAVGDPFFDLAVVVQHHQLGTKLTKIFLRAYFGSLLPEHLEKLRAYCMLYDQLAGLWYLSMAGNSGLAPNFDDELKRVMARLEQEG